MFSCMWVVLKATHNTNVAVKGASTAACTLREHWNMRVFADVMIIWEFAFCDKVEGKQLRNHTRAHQQIQYRPLITCDMICSITDRVSTQHRSWQQWLRIPLINLYADRLIERELVVLGAITEKCHRFEWTAHKCPNIGTTQKKRQPHAYLPDVNEKKEGEGRAFANM